MKNYEKKYAGIPVYTIVINPTPPPKPPKELFPLPKEHTHEEVIIVKEVAESAVKLENARKISLGGDLSGALDNVSNQCREFAQSRMEKVSTLMEPIMVLSLGVSVGFIVLAILTPVFDLAGIVR